MAPTNDRALRQTTSYRAGYPAHYKRRRQHPDADGGHAQKKNRLSKVRATPLKFITHHQRRDAVHQRQRLRDFVAS